MQAAAESMWVDDPLCPQWGWDARAPLGHDGLKSPAGDRSRCDVVV